MNFVKRGLRSLLYHWKNTAALVVIYFLSSALVLVGLNIRQACLATAEEAGEKIGADIAVTNTYQANSFTAEERNNLPLTLADQLAALPGVSSASWTATLSGASNNFSSAAMTREDGRAPLLFFASQTSSLLDLFTSQGASLALGRPLEREDRGLALVALPLAEENGWELDSVFSVTAASGQEISLQVAGIYLPGEGTGPEGGLGIPWDNTIVLCLEDARELLGGEQVSQIRLELEDPKDARSLAAAVEETAGASPHQGEFVVQVDDSAYLQVAGPLERMVSLMTLMAAAAVLLGAAILFLLSLLGAKSRDREIGVLLSLGEEKRRIFLQMLLELSLPMVAAVTCAAGAGGPLSQGLAAMAGTHSGPLSGLQIVLLYIAGILLTAAAAIPTAWKVSAYSPVKMLREEG